MKRLILALLLLVPTTAMADYWVTYSGSGARMPVRLNMDVDWASGDTKIVSEEVVGLYSPHSDFTVTEVTSTGVEMNVMDASVNAALMTMGTGADGMDDHGYSVLTVGGLKITRIYADIDGLNAGATADDITGEDGGVANCHLGQITAAINGTIIGGKVEALEALAGGDTTISMWSATEATGAEDAAITGLVETELMSGANLAATGGSAPLTAVPAANEYLYITGDAGGDATYTGGKILITLWGI